MPNINPLFKLPSCHRDDSFEFITQEEQIVPLNKVTDFSDFNDGLTFEVRLAEEFRNKYKQSLTSAIYYIAQHVNPHQILGVIRNIGSFFIDGTLNKNCIICSKAVENNIALLKDGDINGFWIAESTAQGGLPQNISPENYTTFLLKNDFSLSNQLLCKCKERSRNIIVVPVKNKKFTHAMNIIITDIGAFIIDGQFGICYNLNSLKDRHAFDNRYGTGDNINIVQIYNTGEAPDIPDINDKSLLEGWEFVDIHISDDKK
ncbi:hypothetical protein NCT62_004435 [Escherichia coli]|nr:hypothetical protein [Escherichia coli]